MKILQLMLFLLLFASSSLIYAIDTNLLRKLDIVQENVSDSKQRLDAKHKILGMIIQCEFDEQCMLGIIKELQEITKTDHNLVYKGFLKYLTWEKADLEYNAAHCNIPEKREVRKEFAICYEAWINEEIKHPPHSREEIDKQTNNREMCIKNKIENLAKNGNVFAKAQMVNSFQYLRDKAGVDYWSNQLEREKDSAKFNLFLKCAELP